MTLDSLVMWYVRTSLQLRTSGPSKAVGRTQLTKSDLQLAIDVVLRFASNQEIGGPRLADLPEATRLPMADLVDIVLKCRAALHAQMGGGLETRTLASRRPSRGAKSDCEQCRVCTNVCQRLQRGRDGRPWCPSSELVCQRFAKLGPSSCDICCRFEPLLLAGARSHGIDKFRGRRRRALGTVSGVPSPPLLQCSSRSGRDDQGLRHDLRWSQEPRLLPRADEFVPGPTLGPGEDFQATDFLGSWSFSQHDVQRFLAELCEEDELCSQSRIETFFKYGALPWKSKIVEFFCQFPVYGGKACCLTIVKAPQVTSITRALIRG